MPGTKGRSGGKRDGAGRPRRKLTMTVELTEQATQALAYFIADLNLDPHDASTIVSTIISAALRDDLDRWRNHFGNQE